MKPWERIAAVGIAVALLTLGGIGLGQLVLPKTGVPGVSAALPTRAPSGYLETQMLDGNGVSVRVTPGGLGPESTMATFDVVLNTHSVDLSYDLGELAILRLDNGAESAPSGWTGRSGGHHVSGRPTFSVPGLGGVQSVELVLHDVAEVPVWSFAWKLP